MATRPATQQLEPFLAPAPGFLVKRKTSEPGWLAQRRGAALEAFRARGFPTTKDEEWKYTNVAPLLQGGYQVEPSRDGTGSPRKPQADLRQRYGDADLIVVDGRVAHAGARIGGGDPAVRAGSLQKALEAEASPLEPHLGAYADVVEHAFTALNTIYFEDGAYLDVRSGAAVAEPLHILYVSTGGPARRWTHPRSLVVLGEGSRATVVETFAGPGASDYITNSVTEVALGPNASLDHYRIQDEAEGASHVGLLEVAQSRDSRFSSHLDSFGGGLVRNDLNVTFREPGAECVLNGLFIAHGRQHMDNHTRVDHRVPHCSSQEFYKGILDDEATGVFYGKVFIRKNAVKSSASQTNKNLILSGKALVDSTPALEIHNNDVKAAHGSTTGQLDPAALFYLRSRGLDELMARSLLTYAFANDVLAAVKVPRVRQRLDAFLFTRLPNGDAVREALA